MTVTITAQNIVWRRVFLALVWSVVLGISSGCGTLDTPRPRIVWPPPPERPAFEFVDVYSSSENFPRSAAARFFSWFASDKPVTLGQPCGLVVDSRENIIVSDVERKQLFAFNLNLKQVNPFGTAFGSPHGLAIDSEDNVYVVDSGMKQIVVLTPQGDELRTFGSRNLFERPMHIALDEKLRRIYVTDARRHRVSVFTLTGEHLFDFGKFGNAEGEFGMPHGITIKEGREVYVADMLNARIQVFDSDGIFRRVIDNGNHPGLGLEFPRDIAFTSDGYLHIVDIKRAVLTSYSPDGKTRVVIGDEKPSAHVLAFSAPTSIHADKNDRLYIADQGNGRISVWQYLGQGRNTVQQ